MKQNKHIHDEDYDISIKLMVPLLTILVCTICLCATTWAWYTASVSTGVNSIKAGSHESTVVITYPANTLSNEENISAQAVNNETVLSINQGGYYEFDSNVEYKVNIYNDGDSTFGYHCMITVIYNLSDETQTSAVLYTGNFAEEPGITFKLNSLIDCKIKIDTMWGDHPSDTNVILKDDVKIIGLKQDGEITFEIASPTSLREEDTITPPPTYDYLIRFIDSDSQNYEIKEAITGSTPDGSICIEYNDYIIEDYELVLSEDIEMEDGTIWFEIDPNEQVNEFKLFYKMIDTNDDPVQDGDGGETVVDGDNSSTPGTPPGEVSNNENGETNTSTPSAETGSNLESQNNQQSQVNNPFDSSGSDGGFSENDENVSNAEEGIDTTNTSFNEGTEESIPSSNDTDSESNDVSE